MSLSKLLSDWLTGYNDPPQRTQRQRSTGLNRSPQDKLIVVKHKGRLKTYRVNKYGEVFEE